MAKAKVVIRGNVKACSYCEAFMGAGGADGRRGLRETVTRR